jgi:hypothetical protein
MYIACSTGLVPAIPSLKVNTILFIKNKSSSFLCFLSSFIGIDQNTIRITPLSTSTSPIKLLLPQHHPLNLQDAVHYHRARARLRHRNLRAKHNELPLRLNN